MPIIPSTPQLADLIHALLRRPIAFHRIFADIAEGALPGLFLSQAWYWSTKTQDAEGWFYKTQAEWEEETALTRWEQESARKRLRHLGLLSESYNRLEHRMHYKLNVETLHSRMWENHIRECGNPTIQNGAFPHSLSETTSEREEDLSQKINPCGTAADSPVPQPPVKRPRKAIAPLPETDWLYQQLCIYDNDFDVAALNDDEWWANMGNSFPVFHESWVKMAFADLAAWLQDNPVRTPRTPRGWKQRMRYSLNRYYDKHMRREPNGRYPTR